MIRTLAIVATLAVVGAAALWHPPPKPAWTMASPSPRASSAGRNETAVATQRAIVYVAGAVRSPGLYAVREGARAADAVKSAGGLLPDADATSVNLAARVADGDEIAVAAAGQATDRRRASTLRRRKSRSRSTHRRGRHDAYAGADQQSESASDQARSALDVNAADASALAAVPGIGPSIAARIVEMRTRIGPFSTLDELLDVAGVTQSKLERARAYLRDP